MAENGTPAAGEATAGLAPHRDVSSALPAAWLGFTRGSKNLPL